mmetsp:Transcript_18053/g.41606  ORF Transcript_18053/g.41606 Transcript_18053/m.41606 type:complete len:124 (-) Transcript_18053:2201-2572(-)
MWTSFVAPSRLVWIHRTTVNAIGTVKTPIQDSLWYTASRPSSESRSLAADGALPRARTKLPAVNICTVNPSGVSASVPTPAQNKVLSGRYAIPRAAANLHLNLASVSSDKNKECIDPLNCFVG